MTATRIAMTKMEAIVLRGTKIMKTMRKTTTTKTTTTAAPYVGSGGWVPPVMPRYPDWLSVGGGWAGMLRGHF